MADAEPSSSPGRFGGRVEADAPAAPRSVAGHAAITSVAQLATMGIGALLAVVVLLKFGKNARTDGFFAAYGVYGVLVIVAQSVRSTMVARLVEGPSLWAALHRLFGGAGVIFALAAVPLVALGGPLAALLTGDLGPEARDTARSVLVVLWLAAGAQLVAGLGAAALSVRSRFALPGLAYVLGGLLSVACCLGLAGRLSIGAVPLGIAAGSALTATIMLVALARLGYRGRGEGRSSLRGSLRAARLMLGGGLSYLIVQITFVVSLAFAARLGAGAVTLYTYAFVATSFVIAAASSSVGVAIVAPLSETWDRRPESLRPHLLAAVRVGLAAAVPTFATAAVIGDEVAHAVLGASLGPRDVQVLVATFLCLAGVVLLNVGALVPQLASFARSHYAAVAAIAAGSAVVHVLLSLLALRAGRLEGLGLAASASALLTLALNLALVYGRGVLGALALLGGELLRVTLLAGAVFVPLGLLGAALGGGGWDMAATALGLAGFALAVPRALPEYWLLLRNALPLAPPARAPA